MNGDRMWFLHDIQVTDTLLLFLFSKHDLLLSHSQQSLTPQLLFYLRILDPLLHRAMDSFAFTFNFQSSVTFRSQQNPFRHCTLQ